MEDNKSNVRIGEGVADDWKQEINQELSSIGKEFIGVLSKFVKGKIKGIDLEVLFSKKNEEDLLALWSEQLANKGLIPKVYAGLPDELLIDNMHQTGYLDGMYVGYILALMSLVDNGAPKELILSVRDDIRPNLIGQHYNNKDEFIERFKNEKYVWINSVQKENVQE